MKDIAPLLRTLGLAESEIKTYMAALEHGSSTVIELAKRAKLSRQAVYSAIDSLRSRGLMSSAERAKKNFFSAEHPSRLLAYAKRREIEIKDHIQNLEQILPELELQAGGERPIVKFFEGKEGIRAFLEDVRTSKPRTVDEIGDIEASSLLVDRPVDIFPLQAEYKKLKTRLRALVAGAPIPNNTLSVDRFILPEAFSHFKSNVAIYEDKVSIVTLTGKLSTILIDSKPIADVMRVLFEMAFQHAQNQNYPKKN